MQDELQMETLKLFPTTPNSDRKNIDTPPKKEEPKISNTSNNNQQISMNELLEKSLQIIDQAKLEQSKNKQYALDLYTQALDSLMIVYKNETEKDLKKDIENYLLDYTTRAEKLKEEIDKEKNQQMNQPKTININLNPNQQNNPYLNQFTPNPQQQYQQSQNQSFNQPNKPLLTSIEKDSKKKKEFQIYQFFMNFNFFQLHLRQQKRETFHHERARLP